MSPLSPTATPPDELDKRMSLKDLKQAISEARLQATELQGQSQKANQRAARLTKRLEEKVLAETQPTIDEFFPQKEGLRVDYLNGKVLVGFLNKENVENPESLGPDSRGFRLQRRSITPFFVQYEVVFPEDSEAAEATTPLALTGADVQAKLDLEGTRIAALRRALGEREATLHEVLGRMAKIKKQVAIDQVTKLLSMDGMAPGFEAPLIMVGESTQLITGENVSFYFRAQAGVTYPEGLQTMMDGTKVFICPPNDKNLIIVYVRDIPPETIASAQIYPES
jgi:hypothetical protein